MLRPDTYVQDSDESEEEEEEEEEEQPQLPTTGSYGDGHFGDDDDYNFDDGEEVAF